MKQLTLFIAFCLGLILTSCGNVNKNVFGNVHIGMSQDNCKSEIEKAGGNDELGNLSISLDGYDWLIETSFKDGKLSDIALSYCDVMNQGNGFEAYKAIKKRFENTFGKLNEKQWNENFTYSSKKIGSGYVRVFWRQFPMQGAMVLAQVTNDPDKVEALSKDDDKDQ